MKNAVVAAIVAAFVASGSTYAATRISGRAIRPHSIPANRLTPRAVKAFTAQTAQTPAPRILAAAVNSTIDYERTTTPFNGNAEESFSALCPTGDVAVGGGYKTAGIQAVFVSENVANPDASGWDVSIVGYQALPASTPTMTVYVSCEPGA